MTPARPPLSTTLAALALAGTAACAEVPDDLTPIEQPAPERVEATTSDLLDLLAPAFDLGEFLNELAKPQCHGDGCGYCDVPPG